MIVLVGRSPWRLLGFVLLGSAMIVLALEMTVTFRYYDRPEGEDVVVGSTVLANGSVEEITEYRYTRVGEWQRRRDLAIGSAFVLGGAFLIVWGIRDALSRRPVLEADETGLTVSRLDRGGPYWLSWSDVAEIGSGEVQDEGGAEPVLSISVVEETQLPLDPWGAAVDPPWIHLYAGGWDVPAHQVAARLSAFANPFREAGHW
jgi:hypothetical protein